MPSDEPNTVFQDRAGRIWVGFHDGGLMLFGPGPRRVFTTRDGLPNNEIFSIREAANGDLLIGTRGGLARMHGGHFTTFVPPDPLARDQRVSTRWRIPRAASGWPPAAAWRRSRASRRASWFRPRRCCNDAVVTLCASPRRRPVGGDVRQGAVARQGRGDAGCSRTADGLSSDQIRVALQDRDGTLWIGTFGGGLDALRDGKFQAFTRKGRPAERQHRAASPTMANRCG